MNELTPQQLKEKTDRKDDFQLIDVREVHEHEMVNIGGTLIPMGTVLNNVDTISKDKDVVFYCRSGSRSGIIIRELEKRFGFTNLFNLKGGINAYAREVDHSLPVY